jgi:hypothetical protein
MKKLITTALVALTLAGCATVRNHQIDESPGERKITSETTATTWFTSAQTLTKLRALQTDKTQSFGAAGIEQHGATNAIEALREIRGILEAINPK